MITFDKISRNRNKTHKYNKHVALTCKLARNVAAVFRAVCPKALEKVIKDQHRDMLWIKTHTNLNLVI